MNAARFRAGERIGVTYHVASVLGSYGFSSPTYFPSPADVSAGNDAMLAIARAEPDRVRMMVTVNPNYTAHALTEIERCVERGAIGVKLLASRRADDPLLDPIAELAADRGLPVLHHIWQHRRREWPSQEISDGADLARLANRHPGARFILAHIGGGGDYAHTFPAVVHCPNIFPDLSGSGVDRGMLDDAIAALGAKRLLWGSDLTMCTGLAKLRALDAIDLTADDRADIRWRNAARIFPPDSFPRVPMIYVPGYPSPGRDVNALIGSYPFRHVPHPDADVLVRVLDREGLEGAWVGHLPSAFYRDPTAGNRQLRDALAGYRDRLRPVPTIRPDWPKWERSLDEAVDVAAPAVRAYPPQWGLGPGDARMSELAIAAGERGMALLLTVRFEDLRQRHFMDTAGDLSAAAIRALARAGDGVRLVVTAAGREMIEEVHWGLTTAEQARVFWDISWIWGPPEDHLAKLFRTIGSERFVFGTQWPLRLTQAPRATLDLLPDDLRGARLADETAICAAAGEPRGSDRR